MSTSRETLRFLATICGWVLATGSVALAVVINVPGESPIVQSTIDAATGGDEVVRPASSNASIIGASLSMRVGSEGEDRTLVIEWTGQPQSAVLVVSLDSNDRAPERMMGTGELFGILLLRSIHSEGHAAIVFDAHKLAGVLFSTDLLISVKVVPRLSVQDVIYEGPPRKAPGRVVHAEWLSPSGCTASFQLLDRGDSFDTAILGDIDQLRVGPSHEGRVQATIDVDSIVACLELRVALRADDPTNQ